MGTIKSDMAEVLPVLSWFRGRMEAKLKQHERKQFWRTAPDFDVHVARRRLRDEYIELVKAYADYRFMPNKDHAEELIKECADVANFAMMIADLVRVSDEED